MKHSILKTAAIVAATGAAAGGVTVAAEKGVFHDARWDIDNSPAVTHKLETTIKPKMQQWGRLTIKLAKKAEGIAEADWKDTTEYDPKTNTVTIEARNDDSSVYGSSHIVAKFGAKPGSHEPDADDVRSIEADFVDDDKDIPVSSSIELAAPGEESLDRDYDHSVTPVYSASEGGGIEFKDNPSLGGAHLLNTRNNETFTDSSWGDYRHNPVPTAKTIISDGGQTANVIRDAFEQPLK